MNLFFTPDPPTSVNVPKFVDDKFVPRNNYYIVTDGQRFNSYSIKAILGNPDQPFIRLEKTPPVLLEGYAIIGRRVYLVTREDILRRLVRKSREIKPEVNNGSTADTNTTAEIKSLISTIASTPILDSNESGSSEALEVEITKAANAAWEDQVGALYGIDPEEEEEDLLESEWDPYFEGYEEDNDDDNDDD